MSVTDQAGNVVSETPYWEYHPSIDNTTPAPTIVMVHGFRGDHHGLLLIAAHLPEFRIIVPDLPGFGVSSPFVTGEHDLAAYSEWLAAFVADVRAPDSPLYVLGHSFGSIVSSAAVTRALGTATLGDSLPDKLVLVNPIGAPALSGPRGVLTRLAIFYYWAGAKLPEKLGYTILTSRLITRIASIAMAKTRDTALRRWIHHQHDMYFSAFANRSVVLESFTASVSHDVSEFAPQITVPTLLIAADRDDITALPSQERLFTRFKDAQLRVISRVGHLVHYEKPAEAARLIREFLMRNA